MNYMEGKREDFFIRNSWQVFIVSDIFMLSNNHPGEKNPEEGIHTWAASHKCILHNSKRSLYECIYFSNLEI